jgi:hypothetical protein
MKKKRTWGVLSFPFGVFFLFSLTSALQAQDVDEKIKALEQELTKLKSEQMSLKKEATAQAAAMPTFEYRPGSGVAINTADQSWSINFYYEFAYDMMWLEGNDARREGDFGLFGRRNRPGFQYCWDKCFYQFNAELDMDGDETGTKETLIQRARFAVNLNQLNPWFPVVQTGMDIPGAGSRYRSSDLTFELPLLDRNNGFNTGSHTGLDFQWEDLTAVFFPGTHQFHYYWVIHGMGRSDGLKDQSNKADHVVYYNINPFSQSKSKWLEGIGASVMTWFGNIDDRNATNTTTSMQLRSQEGSTRVVMFTSPTHTRGDPHVFFEPTAQYKVGPYQLRVAGGADRYHSDHTAALPANTKSFYWKFMNDIMLWSPKGFLTGSSTTPGTLGMGWSFERTWADCGFSGCDQANAGTVSRTVVLVRELDFRYWIRPALSLWATWKWYDSSNTPAATQTAVGCSSNTNVGNSGKSCNWHDLVLRLYWLF